MLRKRGVELTEITEEEWEEALREARAICEEDKERVLALGGLHLLGTERHEARRIDNQLRGRSGRQGDPGSSRFYVSLEDDLMRRFGGSTVAGLMDRLGVEEDVPIEHDLVSKSIENAQIKVEGYNFDIRKHLLEYDDVINKQRQLIYDQRRQILSEESLRPLIMEMVSEELGESVGIYTAGHPEEWDLEALFGAAQAILPFPPTFTLCRWEGLSSQEVEDDLLGLAEEQYDEKERRLGRELLSRVERLVLLRVVDNLWIRHLTALDELRQGVGLRAFGQRDPLVEFKTEAYRMFQVLMANIRQDVSRLIYHAEVVRQPASRPVREVREAGARTPGRKPMATAKAKVGRNDPCPCGSGKKYKHCCLRKEKRD